MLAEIRRVDIHYPILAKHTGGQLGIKVPCYQYRKAHYGDDKTILYLHTRISDTAKMASLYIESGS